MISDEEEKQQAQHNLDQTLDYGKLDSCRRKFLLQYFNEDYTTENCANCDQCIEFEALVPVKNKAAAAVSTAGYSYLAERDGLINDDGDFDTDLFDILKQLRIRESKRLKVAPYIVFGDKALRGMCVTKPRTKKAFLEINGVGEKKLKKFGKKFMEVIKEYEG